MSDDVVLPPLGPHGGPRTKGVRNPKILPSGGRRDYILARLERDGRHDLAEAIREGRVSALTIAVEMGWTKRPETLGLGSGNAAKRRQHQLRALTGDKRLRAYQELWLGPGNDGSIYNSPEELRASWEENRPEVMRIWATNGKRPMAWWYFDAPGLGLKWPGYDRQQSYLYDHNVLSEEERTQLLAFWRREFDHNQSPVHLDWADVPASLRRRWMTARKRRPRAAEASEKAPDVASGVEGEEKKAYGLKSTAAAGTLE
jgi:hypothetical protein